MQDLTGGSDDLRAEAARLACTLLRFEEASAHLLRASAPAGALQVGRDAYTFIPSWKLVRREEVASFLAGLSSPALLAPTTIRGSVALLLLDELSGERRRWAEKTFSNFGVILEDVARQLGLAPESRILVEFDDESEVFSFAAVREWSQQLAVQIGWNIRPLDGNARADASMGLLRSDGRWYRGKSCWLPRPPQEPDADASR
ncbi:MAG: hypothetical protein ACM357_04010 [Gemmatimonadota bacterium]